jgi:transposase
MKKDRAVTSESPATRAEAVTRVAASGPNLRQELHNCRPPQELLIRPIISHTLNPIRAVIIHLEAPAKKEEHIETATEDKISLRRLDDFRFFKILDFYSTKNKK